MIIAGLDIGTTTICAVAIDSNTGHVLKSIAVANRTKLEATLPFEQSQDPDAIFILAQTALDELITTFSPKCIGLTGQMHGILYTDKNGLAVSPLYTWQDRRGEESYDDMSANYVQELVRRTDKLSESGRYSPLASGYGSVTHFYNTVNELIPKGADSFCTIQCYVGMRLCGNRRPLLHSSDAASLGLYNFSEACFAQDAISIGKMDARLYPDTTNDNNIIGYYKNIPVSIGIGDNQASFLGAVREVSNSILVNIGTGQQISVLSNTGTTRVPIEIRPFLNESYLLVGADICGGEAYSVLENFFSRVVKMATGINVEKLYNQMNAAALSHLSSTERLAVSTLFCGTRQNSSIRGAIKNISKENFTPQLLIIGFLEGMVSELWNMYQKMESDQTYDKLIGSGNAVRNNPALRKILETCFGFELLVPVHLEEAAFGAALFGHLAAFGKSISDQCIHYQ